MRAHLRQLVGRLQLPRLATSVQRCSPRGFVFSEVYSIVRPKAPSLERCVRQFSSSRFDSFYGSASRLGIVHPPKEPQGPRIPKHCPGCGVKLQREDPNGPGYASPSDVLEEGVGIVVS